MSRRLAGRRRLGGAALLIFVILLIWPLAAWAHPLGNFTVNRYSRLELHTGQVDIHYVLDMAEIPAFQERGRIDADSDGAIAPNEHERYLAEQVANLRQGLRLTAAGRALPLLVQAQNLEFPPGQGGLSTLRLTATFVAPLPSEAASWQMDYHDANFADRLGWKEIVVAAGDGARLLASTAPTVDLSDELRSYPQDLLQNPPDLSAASFRFELLASGQTTLVARGPSPAPVTGIRSTDRFAALIETPILGPGALLLALLAALGWGALHAFTPGHGKTVVGAYLVGARGTTRHALFLGLTTTVTHTAGVFALGLLTLFASRYILPEQLYPWLSLASGLLVTALGLSLLRQRMGVWRHSLAHRRGLAHDHPHDHHHHHGHAHVDLQNDDHSHLPLGADGAPVTWRSLLALGVSGGLTPCPSALVVMLGAVAVNRIGLGLALIVAFSLGLAGVLTAIGLFFVHAGRLVERAPVGGRLLAVAPVASAALVAIIGLGIAWQALVQVGVI